LQFGGNILCIQWLASRAVLSFAELLVTVIKIMIVNFQLSFVIVNKNTSKLGPTSLNGYKVKVM